MALSARRLHPHFVAAIAGLDSRVIPEDRGETRFTGPRAAYDALPDRAIQRLEGLTAEHSLLYSRGTIGFTDFSGAENSRLGASPRPLVRTHPGSKRKTLYPAAHAMKNHGMAVPEGRIPLKDFMDHAPRPGFGYTHRWTAGDPILWDNRCTMHRAREYDPAKVREPHRTTVMEATSPMAELTRSVA